MKERQRGKGGASVARFLISGFLVAHGLIHAAIWLPPLPPDAPFDAKHSWLFGDVRSSAMALALTATVAFGAAGMAYFTGEAWWALASAVGALVSLALIALTFTPWWLAAVAINLVLLGVVWAGLLSP